MVALRWVLSVFVCACVLRCGCLRVCVCDVCVCVCVFMCVHVMEMWKCECISVYEVGTCGCLVCGWRVRDPREYVRKSLLICTHVCERINMYTVCTRADVLCVNVNQYMHIQLMNTCVTVQSV